MTAIILGSAYPEGRAPTERKYPCIACRAPLSAVRVGTRCRKCSDLDQRTRGRVRTRPVVREVPAVAWYDNDSDIATYRAEKLAKTERGPATRAEQALRAAAAQIASECVA